MPKKIIKITDGIKVTVNCSYNEEHSAPPMDKYLFVYGIKIENLCPLKVQLKRRHWFIFDSIAGLHEVDGEGVVGQQPILYPGHQFYYESFCPLGSEIGNMSGYFTFIYCDTNEEFSVDIPKFDLIFPQKLN